MIGLRFFIRNQKGFKGRECGVGIGVGVIWDTRAIRYTVYTRNFWSKYTQYSTPCTRVISEAGTISKPCTK